ncbi:hypothetical protein Aduo_014363 [Ancylostoma duodenale]
MPRRSRVVHAAPQRNGFASPLQVASECHGVIVWFMRFRKQLVLLHHHRSPPNATAFSCGSCGSAKKWCCFTVAGRLGMPRRYRVVHAVPQTTGVASPPQVASECHSVLVWFMRLRKQMVLLHQRKSPPNATALSCGSCGSANKWRCFTNASRLGMPRRYRVVHAAPQTTGVASPTQVASECHGVIVWFMRLRKQMVLLLQRKSPRNATALSCGSCGSANKWCCFTNASRLGMPRRYRVVHAAPQTTGVASPTQVASECHGVIVWFMRLRKQLVLLHQRKSPPNATALSCGSCGSANNWCCFTVAGRLGMPRRYRVVHAAPQTNGVASPPQVASECHGVLVWFIRLRKEMVLLHPRRPLWNSMALSCVSCHFHHY